MIKYALKNRHLKSTFYGLYSLKHLFPRLFSTENLSVSTLFSHFSYCLYLLFLLIGEGLSPLYAQSGGFDGNVGDETPPSSVEYTLTIEKKDLNGKTVAISVTGDGVSGGSDVYTITKEASVTVSLSTPSGVNLTSLLGTSEDGRWFLTPLSNPLPTQISFTMPATNIKLTYGFKVEESKPGPEPDPTPDPDPVAFYTVTVPEVEGAVTDPVAGQYLVEAWTSFFFTLTLKEGYEESLPVVTTSRGETLEPDSRGRYKLSLVRSDVTIAVDSIRPNDPPVANERIDAAGGIRIRTSQGQLHIDSDRASTLYIYNIGGSLLCVLPLQAGGQTVALKRGAYLLRIDGRGYKVIL